MNELSEFVSTGEPFSSLKAKVLLYKLFNSVDSMILILKKLYKREMNELEEISKKIKTKTRLELIPRMNDPHGLLARQFENKGEDADAIYSRTKYVYNLNEVKEENTVEVGNKMARLGEIKNVLEIPVPNGFCISIKYFDEVLSHNNLRNKKNDILLKVDFKDIANVNYVCNQTQALIVSTELPDYLHQIVSNEYTSVFKDTDRLLAIRSSAFGEDSDEYSFAGLHKSKLNVNKRKLINAVSEVYASFYSAQSVIYRHISGIREEDMPMSVGCIEMIDARVAGVLYTMDPMNKHEGMIIQSVKGLGDKLVDGSVKPFEIIVTEENKEINVSFKEEKYNTTDIDDSVLKSIQQDSKLHINEIVELYNYAKRIAQHFSKPQDIEWAVDESGKVFILQSRTLRISSTEEVDNTLEEILKSTEFEESIITKSAECASPGFSYGEVYKIEKVSDIENTPNGAVVVAKTNSLKLTTIIHKCSAIITEIGSTTGHLSIIARELKIPLLTNVENIFNLVSNGRQVSVFADYGIISDGLVLNDTAIRSMTENRDKMFLESPVFKIWSKLINSNLKLNLTDSELSIEKTDNILTIHDLVRYIHEASIQNMFNIKSTQGFENEKAHLLDIEIPIKLYVIDIGGGLSGNIDRLINLNQIKSKSLTALINGMLTPGIKWSGFVALDAKGFSEMVLGNIASTNNSNLAESTRSYCVVSSSYLNFFTQLGYHFSRVDALVSKKFNQNYVNLNFRGGAASEERKMRRIKAISQILEHYGFNTNFQNDEISARIKNIAQKDALELLSMIGLLMGAVRNVDAAMSSDRNIDVFVEEFLKGNPSPASMF